MRIGRLRHRIALQAPARSTNAASEEVKTYPATTATVWAEVLDDKGGEGVSSREEQATTTAKIRIRYRADVDVDWRVVFAPGGSARTRTYEVRHIADIRGRRSEQLLLCEEIR